MTHPEQQYLDLINRLLKHGDHRADRTGVGTRALFGEQMRFDLADGFPVFTTKRVYWKTAFKEMLWMLRGETNIRPLLEQNVHIWS
ncbi:MAG TPA: thymidylate synthase, partial [Halothiobacillaceae bacterium]|nr:thymidylate synthase [Halothiobacillaceae bacterium]